MKRERALLVLVTLALLGDLFGPALYAQLQQSGGPGSSVTAAQGSAAAASGRWPTYITDGTNTMPTGDASARTIHVTTDNASQAMTLASLPALATGSNIVGFVRTLPAGCTQTTRFSGDTVGVATAAGTSVTATTTCIGSVYLNNITNSAVTFRLADKTGTPVIWVGGNADFSIPANSNMGLPFLAGVTFTSGITAIAGTGSAINLHVEGWQ
jgi:hypothetical protein